MPIAKVRLASMTEIKSLKSIPSRNPDYKRYDKLRHMLYG